MYRFDVDNIDGFCIAMKSFSYDDDRRFCHIVEVTKDKQKYELTFSQQDFQNVEDPDLEHERIVSKKYFWLTLAQQILG